MSQTSMYMSIRDKYLFILKAANSLPVRGVRDDKNRGFTS